MPVRLVLAAAVGAALLACERGGDPSEAAATDRPARAAVRGEEAPPPAAVERAGDGRTAGRRGDRHARAAARQSPTVKKVEGTVARAGERLVVIRPAGAAELTLRVAPRTTVTLDGKPARAAALPEGAEVRAAYETGGGGRPTALRLEARAPPPAPDPPPEPSGG